MLWGENTMLSKLMVLVGSSIMNCVKRCFCELLKERGH